MTALTCARSHFKYSACASLGRDLFINKRDLPQINKYNDPCMILVLMLCVQTYSIERVYVMLVLYVWSCKTELNECVCVSNVKLFQFLLVRVHSS